MHTLVSFSMGTREAAVLSSDSALLVELDLESLLFKEIVLLLWWFPMLDSLTISLNLYGISTDDYHNKLRTEQGTACYQAVNANPTHRACATIMAAHTNLKYLKTAYLNLFLIIFITFLFETLL